MIPSWTRSARRKRLIGLTYMTTAAVALATAALLFMLGNLFFSFLAVFGTVFLLVSSIYAFTDARDDERHETT